PIQFIMFPVPYDSNYCDSYSTTASDGYTAGVGQAQQLYNKAVAAGLPVSGGMPRLAAEPTTACGGRDSSAAATKPSVLAGTAALQQAGAGGPAGQRRDVVAGR